MYVYYLDVYNLLMKYRNAVKHIIVFVFFLSAVLVSKVVAASVLYVGDNITENIYSVSPSGDVSTFASTYTGRGNSLPSPSALACDSSGNLFYGTSISATITKINTSGQVNPFATIGGYVTALTFDPFGNLYAGASDTIYKITSSGDVSTFASTYTGRGNSLPSPSALACDASGNVYAGTSIAGLIYEFSPNGEFNAFATIGGSAQVSALTFGVPEPSTYALFGLGAIGLLVVLRRKKAV